MFENLKAVIEKVEQDAESSWPSIVELLQVMEVIAEPFIKSEKAKAALSTVNGTISNVVKALAALGTSATPPTPASGQ